mgnify:CR=1 FL=1
MKTLKELYVKYRHGIPLLIYMPLYLTWFAWLEERNRRDYSIIHVAADDYIPFCEIFVIPYFLWFAYVAVTVVFFFFFKNRQDFYKCCAFLFTGMTIFLIISTLWPNGHHLRLAQMPRDNIFTQAVTLLWGIDTPTNLWPSIHVYNSIAIMIAVWRSKCFVNHRIVKTGMIALGVSIIFSTVLIKQHSMLDVLLALLLSAVMYSICYKKTTVREKRVSTARNRVGE